jgi:hypothetical protein
VPHHLGTAACTRRDRLEELAILLRRDALPQQVDRHDDRGQDVVQIVRDAAGQRSDTGEALRPQVLTRLTTKLRVRFDAFSDVMAG